MISIPDTLLARIIKTKYCPLGDFMGSSLGHNPSYTWQSLFSSKIVLKKGSKWRIGDDSNINLWTDPWLQRENNCYPSSPTVVGLENLRVIDIIQHDTKGCNMDLVNNIFNEEDADIVSKTPLLPQILEDKLIWASTIDGSYSVKSAYLLIMEKILKLDHLASKFELQLLWNKKRPPRVKMMIWRACRSCLPTRANLRTRGVECPITCSFSQRTWKQHHIFWLVA